MLLLARLGGHRLESVLHLTNLRHIVHATSVVCRIRVRCGVVGGAQATNGGVVSNSQTAPNGQTVTSYQNANGQTVTSG